MIRYQLFVVSLIVSILTISCSQTYEIVPNAYPTLIEYEVTMVASRPQNVHLSYYTLAQIIAPEGVKIIISEAENVTVSPSGWAVSKAAEGDGSFRIEIVDCFLKCPVEVTIVVSR